MTNVTCKFLFVCSQSLFHFTEVIYMFIPFSLQTKTNKSTRGKRKLEKTDTVAQQVNHYVLFKFFCISSYLRQPHGNLYDNSWQHVCIIWHQKLHKIGFYFEGTHVETSMVIRLGETPNRFILTRFRVLWLLDRIARLRIKT